MNDDVNVIAPRVRAVENMVARSREKTNSKQGGPACVNCHVKMWLSFFFDGTGNHRDNDFPRNHSNVAALFDAHIDDRGNAIASLYYQGIGTLDIPTFLKHQCHLLAHCVGQRAQAF
ncbi:DUF2235 domain-containing protein [Xanthomonas oryzae]|uniref:DUF2235 domain-containing protein n=1 Tax=Xanthomonas oryzae TaxID=347 RepID=UPI00117CD5C7|nr:DUF2235 domain-containing protein [Xanthomonas oryzae]